MTEAKAQEQQMVTQTQDWLGGGVRPRAVAWAQNQTQHGSPLGAG